MSIPKKAVLWLSISLTLGAVIAMLPFRYLLHFSLDDSYFYLKIAQNISSGFGSTFDGINPTNGYHPLWLWIISGLFYCLKPAGITSPEQLYIAVFILTSAINTGSVILLIGIIEKTFGRQLAVSAKIILVLMAVISSLYFVIGLENQLSIFLFVLWLFFRTGKNCYIPGALLGLLCLSRIDYAVMLFPFLIIYEIFHKSSDNSDKNSLRIIYSLMLPLLMMTAYFYSNLHFFNHFSTTSARAQFRPGSFLLYANFPRLFSEPIRFGLLCFSLSGIAYFPAMRNTKLPPAAADFFGLMKTVWIAGIISIFVHYCFNLNGAREWYYSFTGFISAVLLLPVLTKHKVGSFAALTAIICSFILFATVFRLNYYRYDDAYDFAKKIKNATPENSVLYMSDLSGMISFYSERKVMNGDGLVNSHEYIDCMAKNDLKSFFACHPFDYYVTYSYGMPVHKTIFTDSLFSPGGYQFTFPARSIIVQEPKIHGGIFRKKYGVFYLVKASK